MAVRREISWAVSEQEGLLRNLDQDLIDRFKKKPNRYELGYLFLRYKLSDNAHNAGIANAMDAFADFVDNRLRAVPSDLAQANAVWLQAVMDWHATARAQQAPVPGGGRPKPIHRTHSLMSKVYWFYQPCGFTMYDTLARKGVDVYWRENRKTGPATTAITFIPRFEEIFGELKTEILEAAKPSNYPYPYRILDKYLWLLGKVEPDEDC